MATKNVDMKESLHGETAARRQAITELLFFSSVGDLYRCKKITTAWNLELKDKATADYDRRTPLHLAAAEGCHSVAAWLLKNGVDVNPIDRFKRTPLEDAVRGDHGEVAQLLISGGGKVVSKAGELVELADSPLAGNVRIFTDYDPEWEIDPNDLTLMEKIGEGEFGIVHKARWHGTIVAVKILKETGAVALGDFRTELNVLQKVHHPYTVQFLGAVTKYQPFMIVTEYMAGGSMSDIFRANRLPNIALDCARGLAYQHNQTPHAVIHRDLKPANLMLGGPKVYNAHHKKMLNDEIGVLKIADFGLSKSLKLSNRKKGGGSQSLDVSSRSAEASVKNPEKGESYKLTGETGSYRYMAPEVFRHEQYNNKVDVYSFAMIYYQLLEGILPFYTMEPVEAARAAALDNLRPEWSNNPRSKETRTDAALDNLRPEWSNNPRSKKTRTDAALDNLRPEWSNSPRSTEAIPDKAKRIVEQCWAPDQEERPELEDVIDELEALAADMRPRLTDGPPKSSASSSSGACCSLQ
eukprot:gene6021-5329_t